MYRSCGCDHRVLIETNAGLGSGFWCWHENRSWDCDYNRAEAWAAELVVKKKRAALSEYQFCVKTCFCYLLAYGNCSNWRAMLAAKTTGVAYENCTRDTEGQLPLLVQWVRLQVEWLSKSGSLLDETAGGSGFFGVLGVPKGKIRPLSVVSVLVHAAHRSWFGAQVTIRDQLNVSLAMRSWSLVTKSSFTMSNPFVLKQYCVKPECYLPRCSIDSGC